MKQIGLTGSIGAGKSTVSERLRELGAVILDADVAAREIVLPGTEGLQQVVGAFGTEILQPDGTLDRKKLAQVVFGSDDKRRELNAIMHPLVKKWFREHVAQVAGTDSDAVVVHDVPLLFEAQMDENLDEIWVVIADDEVRVRRIMERDTSTRDEALSRIRTQMPQEEKVKRATHVIYNSRDLPYLICQVDELYARLREKDGSGE